MGAQLSAACPCCARKDPPAAVGLDILRAQLALGALDSPRSASSSRVSQNPALQQSDVGGIGASPSNEKKKKKDLIRVAFWGICDIKYDARLAKKEERVRVLELGDGRSSKFSHHGRAVKERFDNGYCMDDNPIKRAVMTENKKFTHDMFVQEGFAHLRPPTAAYPRRYSPCLAQTILQDVKAVGGEVVLKLANRSRGAGIVVVSAADLDATLQRLLKPPLGAELDAWIEKRMPQALCPDFSDIAEGLPESMAEACLHWWANECPIFVVERCCCSIPEPMDPDAPGAETYDGTMRVGFALYRRQQNKYREQIHVAPFEIDWLGGYWKMPKVSVQASGKDAGLHALHHKMVSSFNSVEKRTAMVRPEHLQEVYDALTPALPLIFGSGTISVQMIMNVYREDALFCAFALARIGAAARVSDMGKAKQMLDLAKGKLSAPKEEDAQAIPEKAALSYIERNLGVCAAMKDKWAQASEAWRISLKHFPLNATTNYLMGCYYMNSGDYEEALKSMTTSLVLDPDYKSPYVGMANARMVMRDFLGAIKAAEGCLQRHPDSPIAQFIIGQSIYHRLQFRANSEREDASELAERAKSALELARRRVPEQWNQVDEKMLEYFLEGGPKNLDRPRAPGSEVHCWNLYAWRP